MRSDFSLDNYSEKYLFLEKNLNASRHSQYSPVRGENVKSLGGVIDWKDETSSWHLNGFPYMVVTLGQQNNVGKKPTVILPPVLSTCPLHTNNSGCGKERRILIGPW